MDDGCSSNSNFRLTGPNCDGLIAMGDIERRVAKVLRRVGDGDKPYGRRKLARLFVGLGLEQPPLPLLGNVPPTTTCKELVNSSDDLHDQFSATKERSSQLCDICMALCTSRS